MQRIALAISVSALALSLTTGCKIARRIANLTGSKAEVTQENGVQTHRFTGALETTDDRRSEDNSFQDTYNIRIDSGKTVTVSMKAVNGAFDTYLLVGSPDGEEIGQNDDCVTDAPEQGSCVTFLATKSGNYQIMANSYEEGELGAYDVVVEIR